MIQLLIRNSYDHQGPSFKVLWSTQFGQMGITCEPSLISYQILLILYLMQTPREGWVEGGLKASLKESGVSAYIRNPRMNITLWK